MKREARVIGIDDSPFRKGDASCLVIGTFFRGADSLDGVMSCTVQVDGDDATEMISRMILRSKFRHQVRCVFLDGIAVAGFNVIDVDALHKAIKMPVVIIMRKMPDVGGMRKALMKIGHMEKMAPIEKAGRIARINSIYVQMHGIDAREVKEFLDVSCKQSSIPECLRAAHLIAAGVVKGESRGRA